MENKNNEQPLAVVETIEEKRKCKCCGRELPITMFEKKGTGRRKVCMECSRKESGVSDKFKDFTSRELIEELKSRGYKGQLKLIRIEEVKL